LSRLFTASVAENRRLIKDHYLLTLNPSEKIKTPKPGTFFMLSTDEGRDPLLKRPISIHRFKDGHLQFLFRVAGKGTTILSRKKPGNRIELLGPLGNGFSVRKSKAQIILLAGGLGIAPIFRLAESVAKRSPLLILGARTKSEVLCLDKLESLGIIPVIATDDGSLGRKGNVLNALKGHLSHQANKNTDYEIYACGPGPMLKALAGFTLKKDIPGQAAFEKNMACGVGTCLGCVINTIKGYKRVCKEGPVFPINEIIWE
jgi:dihydroorotate dehydrogenase electron transfer subunit